MLKRNIGICVLLAMLVGSVFVLVFSTPKIADAGPIAIYEGTEWYICVRGSDMEECDREDRPYTLKIEPFLHKINPFAHPHPEPEPIDQDIYDGEVVTYCMECDMPSW